MIRQVCVSNADVWLRQIVDMTNEHPVQNKRKKRYPEATQCELGSLEDLRASGKGGLDPNGRGSTIVATDVLWSDPVGEEGLCLNSSRGVGVIFGPDVTQVHFHSNEGPSNTLLTLRCFTLHLGVGTEQPSLWD